MACSQMIAIDEDTNHRISVCGERKLLFAVIVRAIFDIESYLSLDPPMRDPHRYDIAYKAFSYIHSRGRHNPTHNTVERDYFLSFNNIMSELFNSESSKVSRVIKKTYYYIPKPFTENPAEMEHTRKRYRSQLVRYTAKTIP